LTKELGTLKTIRMDQEWRHFFTYSYPRYYVNKGFTKEQFRNLVSNADDRQHNQLRVDKDGEVYYSYRYVGAQDIDCVKFKYETLCAFNAMLGRKQQVTRNILPMNMKI
jgi:hypothetical protein